MLWRQHLGHINFCRLSELHGHTRDLPALLSVPDTIDNCAVCLAAKLRKAPPRFRLHHRCHYLPSGSLY